MRVLGTIASSSREVPNAPTIGTATDVGTGRAFNNGAATVTFTAPTFDGGLPITGYTATSSPGGFTGTGAGSPITVTGLQSANNYTFTVRATNAVGTGAASGASNNILATTIPQAPTIGTATAGDASATVAYTANATGGKTPVTYTATSSPGGLTGTGTSPITVSGLTNGTAYTFTVTATNGNGSATSGASNSVTPVAPGAYESIASATPTGTTVTFSSIPSTYKHLQIRVHSVDGTFGDTVSMTLNGSSTGYSYHRYWVLGGATITNSAVASDSRFPLYGGSQVANTPVVGIIDITDYQSTSKTKVIRYHNAFMKTDETAWMLVGGGLWNSTAAVSSISLTKNNNWSSGAVISLYGIKG